MSDCFYFERKKCDGVTIFDYDCFREAYSDESDFHTTDSKVVVLLLLVHGNHFCLNYNTIQRRYYLG